MAPGFLITEDWAPRRATTDFSSGWSWWMNLSISIQERRSVAWPLGTRKTRTVTSTGWSTWLSTRRT